MKRFLLILTMVLATGVRVFAQEEDDDDNEKIRDKMSEYIQKQLYLSKEEAGKFTPIFVKYFKEWRQIIRENKDDKLKLQQKVVDLRLRYRTQFREIIGEPRGDQVFNKQDQFIRDLIKLRQERLRRNPGTRPLRRNRIDR